MSSLPTPRRKQAASSSPPVAERIRAALTGLWLGDVMGSALKGAHLPVPEFPNLYAMPQEVAPPRPPPRAYSLALGFASCGAHCLLQNRQFHLPNLLKTYGYYASLLQSRGKLAPPPPSSPPASQGKPTPPPENTSEAPSLEPALALALESFPRFYSAEAFLMQTLRYTPALPVSDGVLLRCLPAACFLYADREARMKAVSEEALATHAGPLGALGAIAFAAAVAQAIASPHPFAPASELLEAIHQEIAQAAPALAKKGAYPAALQQALAALKEDLAFAQKDNPNLYGPALSLRLHAGQLRVSFRLALWEWFHAPETPAGGAPGAAVEDVIRRGGSPASQGALVAALVGARWGMGALPHSLPLPLPLPQGGGGSPSSSPPPTPSSSLGEPSSLLALAEAMGKKRRS